MASTNKTPRLGLSQWVLSDPFRMEDFNEDNQKIDDGFKAVDQRFTGVNSSMSKLNFEKIGEITTSQSCQEIDLDVSSIEWHNYAKIVFLWQIDFTHLADDRPYCRMQVNGKSSSGDYLFRDPSNDAGGVAKPFVFQQSLKNPSVWNGIHSFETCCYPLLYESVFYTRDVSFASPNQTQCVMVYGGSGGAMPLSDMRALNVFCYNGDSNMTPLTMKAGCKFYIYGVKK